MTSPIAPADAALSWPEAVRDALGILAVDDLEVDAGTRALLGRRSSGSSLARPGTG